MFDLREEREHLLRLQDYLEWYTSGAIPEEPAMLVDVVREGVIYSFNMVDPRGDYRVQGQGYELVISGVTLVRHGTELSLVILCGESVADRSDAKASDFDMGQALEGRELLVSHPDLTEDDRFLEETPEYSRVVGLVRVDLKESPEFRPIPQSRRGTSVPRRDGRPDGVSRLHATRRARALRLGVRGDAG